MQLVRSLLFSIAMIASTVLIAVLLLIFSPAPFNVRSRLARGYACFVISALRLFCNIKYRVSGRENIPDGAAIILSKHQSTWETYALQLFFPSQVWVLKRELLWVPFFGWGMALLKPIAIDRSSGRKAINQIIEKGKQIIEKGKQRLDAGIWVTIFPEGTRIAPGQHKRWGIGGAVLAENSGYPVVPVAHNAGEFWGRRSFLKKQGTIQVVIGAPIETKGLKAAEINQKAEDWVNVKMAEISSVEVEK
jgi:1-acyl-sn-glycerol-3-phosphate acyltransferase